VPENFYLENLDVKVYLKYVNANIKLFRIWLSLVAYSNMILKINDFLRLAS